jgi:hypothetical protein
MPEGGEGGGGPHESQKASCRRAIDCWEQSTVGNNRRLETNPKQRHIYTWLLCFEPQTGGSFVFKLKDVLSSNKTEGCLALEAQEAPLKTCATVDVQGVLVVNGRI